MKHLFNIVGLACVGKSTLVKNFCNNLYQIEYFTNDVICRQIMDLCRIQPYFNIQDLESWGQLDRIINLNQAKYWFYALGFANIRKDFALSEGYLYYFNNEREMLQKALIDTHGDCQVHWLHLLPDINVINQYRDKRSTHHITQQELDAVLASKDLSFIDQTITELTDLKTYIEEKTERRLIETDSQENKTMRRQWLAPEFNGEKITFRQFIKKRYLLIRNPVSILRIIRLHLFKR